MSTARTRQPSGALSEVTSARGVFSKTWEMPGGRRVVVQQMRRKHYDDGSGGDLKEIVTNWQVAGPRIFVDTAPYIAEILSGVIGFRYQSRSGTGSVDVKIASLAGVPVSAIPTPSVEGDKVWWRDVAKDLDIYAEAHPDGVEFFRIMRTDLAPHEHVFEVEESSDFSGAVVSQRVPQGLDNLNKTSLERQVTTWQRFDLEINRVRSSLPPRGGSTRYNLTDTFTGSIYWRDPATRVPVLRSDKIVYPITADTTVTELITANNDDGHQVSGTTTWTDAYYDVRCGSSASTVHYAGLRFQNVSVEQGSTINTATLTVDVSYLNYDPSMTIYADDVDNAAAWASNASNVPDGITKTTASATYAPASTGSYAITVTSIVDEIVSRAGFAKENSIRFAILGDPGYAHFTKFDCLNFPSGDEASLYIDYTAGGGAAIAQLPVVTFSALQATATSSAAATAQLPTATFKSFQATAVAAQAATAQLPTATFKTFSATVTSGAAATSQLPTATFSSLQATVTANAVATAQLPTATFKSLEAQASSGDTATAQLPTATFKSLQATATANAVATAQLPTATFKSLEASASAGDVATAQLPTITFKSFGATSVASQAATAQLPTATFKSLEASASVGDTATAELPTVTFKSLSPSVVAAAVATAQLPTITFKALGAVGSTGAITISLSHDVYIVKNVTHDVYIPVNESEDVYL